MFGNGCSVKDYDWNKPRFFDTNNPCYAAEAALMSSLTSEAFNNFGYEVDYYCKMISTHRDEILGEDQLHNIERRFRLSVYMENTPTMQKNYEIQGIDYEELIHLQATVEHFQEASRYNYDKTAISFDVYYPKIGDIMYLEWCDKYYEIINVKTFSPNSTFLAEPMTYEFILKIWRNNHEDVNLFGTGDSDMPIEEFTSLSETFNVEAETGYVDSTSDIFSINDDIEENKKGFDTPVSKISPTNPTNYTKNDNNFDDDVFGGW